MTSPASSSHPLPPPLHLTIRFSTSQPDLELDISAPHTTTILALKHILRTRLSSRSRLRLIYQGRILPDASALSSVLKAPPPPPRNNDDPKGKGKAVEGANFTRVYVNCSIGDELTSEELEKEEEEALKPPKDATGDNSKPTTSTRPRPRGFDRLLQSGITPSEIATLRTQFNSIHTARFTPDQMPSPDTLRNMEDAWIDNNADGLPSGANPLEDENAGMASVLDILIQAMI
ncbi:hypothetical protein ACLX1H_006111 [Fusarium chlamydosporum]